MSGSGSSPSSTTPPFSSSFNQNPNSSSFDQNPNSSSTSRSSNSNPSSSCSTVCSTVSGSISISVPSLLSIGTSSSSSTAPPSSYGFGTAAPSASGASPFGTAASPGSSGSSYERLKTAAEDGDLVRLYQLMQEDPTVLEQFDHILLCDTPLHKAAEKGQSRFAVDLLVLKPSLARKLNTSGWSFIHIALQNDHLQMVRKMVALDRSFVSIKGAGNTTVLHHVAQKGDEELLSELLFACPSSIEDLTAELETAIHIAVKNFRVEAFRVLLGWVKTQNRLDILDWKNEDGNTVLHIAASTNQIEVMKLLQGLVKVNAKNLNGETAMDLTTSFPCRGFFSCWRDEIIARNQLTLGRYLMGVTEGRLGSTNMSRTEDASAATTATTEDNRGTVLVVATLILTIAYQACLTPPAGLWQDHTMMGGLGHRAGTMIMPFIFAIGFCVLTGYAIFVALHVIIHTMGGLPRWRLLCSAVLAIGFGNSISLFLTLPGEPGSDMIIVGVLAIFFPLAIVFIILKSVVSYYMSRFQRARVDYPGRYFK